MEVTTLQGNEYLACRVAFSPDGKYLAFSFKDYYVRLWSIES
jgi:WD40 repeat protein